MAWDLLAIPGAGTIATIAGWATKVVNNFRYLKGIDGVVTTQSGLIIDNSLGSEYIKLPLLSTAECTSVLTAEGQAAHDEATHRIKLHDGTAVRSLVSTADVDDTPANGATTDPVSSNWAFDHLALLTTAGDLPYATAASTWARLALGTQNYILRAGASAPEWANLTAATIIRKSADETVSNSTVLQNDNHLVLPVGANDVWHILLVLKHISTEVAGLDWAFTVPVAGAITWFYPSVGGAIAVAETDATAEQLITGVGANRTATYYLTYIGGANAGSVQLQWAQNGAEVSDTKVLANSHMIAYKLA